MKKYNGEQIKTVGDLKKYLQFKEIYESLITYLKDTSPILLEIKEHFFNEKKGYLISFSININSSPIFFTTSKWAESLYRPEKIKKIIK